MAHPIFYSLMLFQDDNMNIAFIPSEIGLLTKLTSLNLGKFSDSVSFNGAEWCLPLQQYHERLF